jgi:tRNA G18 (ribose-2'-O)-methylase SpoU
MSPVVRISDVNDPRIADYRNVPDAELLSSRGLFVAEGRLVVSRLLTSRFRTRSVLLTDKALAGDDLKVGPYGLVTFPPDLAVFVASQDAMNAITGFNIHRGCLALGERPAPASWADVSRDGRTVVVLEAVANADNVGGVFRNAGALGASAVLLGPACADPLYRKAIRTSMGAALSVPFAKMTDWPADLDRLRASGFRLLALTPRSDAEPLDACAARLGRDRVALLLGHEEEGLSDAAIAAADACARIPIAQGVDSLNVVAAAAIALYELGGP